MKTGIDAIAFDVAKIHLPIKTLANARNIEPEKLEKGLGLIKMTLPGFMLEPKVPLTVQSPLQVF